MHGAWCYYSFKNGDHTWMALQSHCHRPVLCLLILWSLLCGGIDRQSVHHQYTYCRFTHTLGHLPFSSLCQRSVTGSFHSSPAGASCQLCPGPVQRPAAVLWVNKYLYTLYCFAHCPLNVCTCIYDCWSRISRKYAYYECTHIYLILYSGLQLQSASHSNIDLYFCSITSVTSLIQPTVRLQPKGNLSVYMVICSWCIDSGLMQLVLVLNCKPPSIMLSAITCTSLMSACISIGIPTSYCMGAFA